MRGMRALTIRHGLVMPAVGGAAGSSSISSSSISSRNRNRNYSYHHNVGLRATQRQRIGGAIHAIRAPGDFGVLRCLSTRKLQEPKVGTTTPVADEASVITSKSIFYFEAGYALYAKRPSRPFPPPFNSPPSGSFSDPLSTHDRSRDRRPLVNGEMIRGITNGDDAVLVSDNFIGANDGVGAWAARDRGHAA